MIFFVVALAILDFYPISNSDIGDAYFQLHEFYEYFKSIQYCNNIILIWIKNFATVFIF